MRSKPAISYMCGLLLLTCTGCGGDSGTSESGGGDKDDKEAAASVGLNQPAKDGQFEFVVKDIKCGETRIGSADFGEDAQGHFCRLNVKVTNVGDKPQTMFGDNQYLFDAKDRKYSADTGAAIYDPGTKSIFEEINPGNSLDGSVLFDVPKDVQPVKAELHDSAFSGGVEVKLV